MYLICIIWKRLVATSEVQKLFSITENHEVHF